LNRWLLTFALGMGSIASAFAQTHATFVHTPPRGAEAGKPIDIVGNLFGAGDLVSAKVVFRSGGGPWMEVQLDLEYGDVWRATIPGEKVAPPFLEYYVVAKDYFRHGYALFGSEKKPQRIAVIGVERGTPVAHPVPETETPEPPPSKPPPPRPKAPPATPAQSPPPPTSEPPPPESKPEEKDEELAAFAAEDVVTLATRQAQTVSEAPAAATGIPDEQLRALPLQILPDALKLVPGLDVSRDFQGFWQVSIRGIRDNPGVLVMYDGHALNNFYDGQALMEVPLENVERVEVVRGPGSALYGADAFLGVIDIVSKRREEIDATATAGSFGTFEGHLSAGHKFDLFSVFVDASYIHSSGYTKPIQQDSLTSSLVAQGLLSNGQPAGYTDDHHDLLNVGAELRAAWTRSDTTVLSARYLYEARGALIGEFDAVGPGSALNWGVLLADLKHVHRFESGQLQLRLYADDQNVTRDFRIAPNGYVWGNDALAPDGLWEDTQFETQTFGGEISLDLELFQGNHFTAGVFAQEELLPNFKYETNVCGETLCSGGIITPPGLTFWQSLPSVSKRLVVGAYVQDVWRIVQSLSVTAGLRFDGFQLPEVDTTGTPSLTRFVTSFDPRLGIVWAPGGGFSVKLLYGHAFRAPTLQELVEQIPDTIFSQGRFNGSPLLKPETQDTGELALEWVMPVGEARLRVRGGGFVEQLNNVIAAVDTSGNNPPLSNEYSVLVYGLEAEVRFEVSSRGFTLMNYSWQRATDLLLDPGFNLLTDVPQYRFNWMAQIPIGSWMNFSAVVSLGAERQNDSRTVLESLRPWDIPAYTLVGFQLRTQPIFDRFELAVQVQNAFNYNYLDDVPRPDRDPGLLPGPGTAIYGLIRVRI
jgi:outer membrane receptor protein involved in Fe transport